MFNHFEVMITLIFAIFLSRHIQSPITQKLQEGDIKFSILFEADKLSSKLNTSFPRSTLKPETNTILI